MNCSAPLWECTVAISHPIIQKGPLDHDPSQTDRYTWHGSWTAENKGRFQSVLFYDSLLILSYRLFCLWHPLFTSKENCLKQGYWIKYFKYSQKSGLQPFNPYMTYVQIHEELNSLKGKWEEKNVIFLLKCFSYANWQIYIFNCCVRLFQKY